MLMDINGHTPLYEDYISFEIAKLLKEKGFNEPTETIIYPDNKIVFVDINSVSRIPHQKLKNSEINLYDNGVCCPTHQMALKWLREIHNIFIQIDYVVLAKKSFEYLYEIHDMRKGRSVAVSPFRDDYETYEEACEEAIKYCLTNLI